MKNKKKELIIFDKKFVFFTKVKVFLTVPKNICDYIFLLKAILIKCNLDGDRIVLNNLILITKCLFSLILIITNQTLNLLFPKRA